MKRSFWAFAGRSIVVHTLTYTLAAVAVALLLHGDADAAVVAGDLYRGPDSPWSFAGPFLQPIRGLLFALAIWPVWDMFVTRKTGWLRLWLLLVGVSIIASPVAGVGSLEGFIRTDIATDVHIAVLPELLAQTLAFSVLLVLWDRWTLRRELKAYEKGTVRATSGMARCALVAAMGYIGVAAGGLVVIAASPALSFDDLSADAPVQLFNVALIVVNFVLARVLAAQLFVPEKRRTGFFSIASLLSLVLFAAINAGGAAAFDNAVGVPMPTALILAVYAVASVILWASAVTLLPGVPAGAAARGRRGPGGEGDGGEHGTSATGSGGEAASDAGQRGPAVGHSRGIAPQGPPGTEEPESLEAVEDDETPGR